MAAVSAAALPAAAAAVSMRRKARVTTCAQGLNCCARLRASTKTMSLGLPTLNSSQRFFLKVWSSMGLSLKGKKRGGGALTASCNAAEEIFRIAAIMNGLVLVGVAVGFALIRVEAWLEESE